MAAEGMGMRITGTGQASQLPTSPGLTRSNRTIPTSDRGQASQLSFSPEAVRLATMAGLVEHMAGAPRVTPAPGSPAALVALTQSAALSPDSPSPVTKTEERPPLFQALVKVDLRGGHPGTLTVETRTQGQKGLSQSYALPDEPNRAPAAIQQLAQAYVAAGGEGFSLQVTENSRTPPTRS